MQKALTNKTLEALKPQAKRYEVHDLLCPGMSVRVSAQGQKVFSVKFCVSACNWCPPDSVIGA